MIAITHNNNSMKYFIDTEFLEGTQKEKFPISLFRKETQNTIDLISIGIVSEDNREYYAISKDFNLKEAWNRYDLEKCPHFMDYNFIPKKIYWIRENVLKPIFVELWQTEKNAKLTEADFSSGIFNYKNLKSLIEKYGKTNKEIADEIESFTSILVTEKSENQNDFVYRFLKRLEFEHKGSHKIKKMAVDYIHVTTIV